MVIRTPCSAPAFLGAPVTFLPRLERSVKTVSLKPSVHGRLHAVRVPRSAVTPCGLLVCASIIRRHDIAMTVYPESHDPA